MQARIVGPEAELGSIGEGLSFFGHWLSREWAKIDPAPEHLKKLQGNKYVELKGAGASEAPADDTTVTTKARLDELGIKYAANASPGTLSDLLVKAEAAKTKADEEVAAAQAEADRLAAAAQTPAA